MNYIIFDFDGTIADSLPAVIKTFEDMTKRPKRFTPEEIAGFRNLSAPELAYLLKIPKWKIPILLFRGRRLLRRHLRSIDLHEGIEEVIKELHARGDKLYVLSSNSRQNVTDYLRWRGLEQYFVNVYGGASVLGKAPKLTRLIRREHIDTEHTWYIGDEVRDIQAAKVVEVRAGAVSWGYNSRQALAAKEPDALFDTPRELAEKVK